MPKRCRSQININNDPLLTELLANDLVKRNKTRKLFIDSKQKFLNVYGALVKCKDFHVNTKNSFLKRTPYLIDKRVNMIEYLKRLPGVYKINDYEVLRQTISSYYLSDRLDYDIFKKWFVRGRFPLVFYRVLSWILNDEAILVKNLAQKLLTNVNGSGMITLPLYFNDFLYQFNFYLAGIIMGDGTINNERIKIVDGDANQSNLKYSKGFLTSLGRKIAFSYDIRVAKPHKVKNKNAYELLINNKWLGRYFNFFFSIQLFKKMELSMPVICTLSNDSRLYQRCIIRGLFDTDGSSDSHRVVFITSFKQLSKDVRDYFDRFKIETKESKIKKKLDKTHYKLSILTNHLKDFAYAVGFSHPKKQKALLNDLSDNTIRKMVIKINFDILARSGLAKKSYKLSDRDAVDLATYTRPVVNAGKIRLCNINNKKTEERITHLFKTMFGIKVSKTRRSYYVYSTKLERLFRKSFLYGYERTAINGSELIELKRDWDLTLRPN